MQPRTATFLDDGGRSLWLVAALASHHDVNLRPGGKTGHAELDTPPP